MSDLSFKVYLPPAGAHQSPLLRVRADRPGHGHAVYRQGTYTEIQAYPHQCTDIHVHVLWGMLTE